MFRTIDFLIKRNKSIFTNMKLIVYLAHALFWVFTAWLIVNSFSIQGQEIEIINGVETIKTTRDFNLIYQILICVGISFCISYLNLLNIRSLTQDNSKIKTFLLSGILLFVGFMIYLFCVRLFFAHALLLPMQLTLGIFLFYFAISTAYGIIMVWFQVEQRQKDLELSAKRAELHLLRNQLQPHFLFNALNNLLSMVDQKRSPQLTTSIEKLSQLLRYVIEESKVEKTSIQNEIQFIQNYIDLQSLRFEENELTIQCNILGYNKTQLVEPGLFIPFVENAIKYGTEPEVNSTIDIRFDLSDPNSILFTIKNKHPGVNTNKTSTGTGILAIRERLQLVYPSKHKLEIIQNEQYTVNLKIQTN